MTVTAKPSGATKTERWDIHVDGTTVSLSITHRTGTLSPILFLHGFGSTKEDFTDVLLKHEFRNHAIIAYDAPGCGQSICAEPSKLPIPFLVSTAETVLQILDVKTLHVIGHSMGGLTALELSHKNPKRISSFTNIKGNLTSEDCFLSRQIFDFPDTDDEAFFEEFIARTAQAPLYSSSLYASTLRYKVQCSSLRSIFTSMVDLSDHGDFLGKFLALPCSRVFMFGEQFESLPYLPKLAKHGVTTARILDSGQLPMYSNPVAMWHFIRKNIELGDAVDQKA